MADFTGIGSVLDFGSKIIDRLWPDPEKAAAAKLELFKAQQAGEFKEADQAFELAKAQLSVNIEEAKSSNLFVSGWRPAIGWTAAISLFVYYVPYCIVATILWAHQCYVTSTLVTRPDLGIADLIGLVTAMLGIAGLRTAEKFKGVSR